MKSTRRPRGQTGSATGAPPVDCDALRAHLAAMHWARHSAPSYGVTAVSLAGLHTLDQNVALRLVALTAGLSESGESSRSRPPGGRPPETSGCPQSGSRS